MQSLIAAKAHLGVNLAGSQSGRTALIYAVQFNQPRYIHLLVKMGADIDARDQRARSALWYATQTGRVEVAKQLINRGAALLSAAELQNAWETDPELEPEPEPEPEPALPESGAGVELKPQYGEAIATAPNSLHALQPDWSLLHAW